MVIQLLVNWVNLLLMINNVVTTLDCRLDPVRFRSREVTGNSKTFVRELEYHQMVYTQWPENINPSAITNEMRMKLTNPATIGGDTQYFNIVSVNPVIAGTISHHLEIEVQKGYNI